jgi:hypothetical protein
MIVTFMDWKVARAKQSFSDVLRKAVQEPQIIRNRERIVGAVIGEADVASFLRWRADHGKPALIEALRVAQKIAADEGGELVVPARKNRPDQMEGKPRARRHQRRR